MAKRTAVKDLRAGSIEAAPIDVQEWRDTLRLDSNEPNSFWEGVTCDECDGVVVLMNGGGNDEHRDYDTDSECTGTLGYSEGPMMNYWYKVDNWGIEHIGGPEEAARLIADLPLCVVQIDGQYGLALTGGGMDLSWEICEAYTRLGQLPPVHFCDLPAMSGRGDSARDRYIIAACRESIRVQMNWGKNKLRSLRALTTRAKA